MLRRLIAIAAFAPLSCLAGGAYDGIYFCTTSLGTATYVTVNGQPDGRAVFAIPYTALGQLTYGYGIGVFSGLTFSGSTMFGLPFRLNFSATGTTATGTIESITTSGAHVVSNVSCAKIW